MEFPGGQNCQAENQARHALKILDTWIPLKKYFLTAGR